jgi:AraC-like DNA-binding protein
LNSLTAPEHPLISVVDYGAVKPPEDIGTTSLVFDFYQIAIKRGLNAKLKYGQQTYDFDEGVMSFISPNQVFGIEPHSNSKEAKSGYLLLIHPDFLWNTPLAKTIKRCDFFGYSVSEALFLSGKEEELINSIIANIRQEYHSRIDDLSQQIIISQIETLLGYAERFYRRQFITRKITNHDILNRLEILLTDYFNSEGLISKGLPTVQFLAEELNVSPKYLSSLLKIITGQSTQQHIHNKLIDKAKEILSTTNLSVGEVAYQLGFEHPQSFNKLFKKKTQMSPSEFRAGFN